MGQNVGPNQGVELYDVENDPHELKNLADLASLATKRNELKALLHELDPNPRVMP